MSLVTTHHPITARCIDRLGVDFPLLQREEDVLDGGLDHTAGQASGIRRRAAIALRHGGREVFLCDSMSRAPFSSVFLAPRLGGAPCAHGRRNHGPKRRAPERWRNLRYLPPSGKVSSPPSPGLDRERPFRGGSGVGRARWRSAGARRANACSRPGSRRWLRSLWAKSKIQAAARAATKSRATGRCGALHGVLGPAVSTEGVTRAQERDGSNGHDARFFLAEVLLEPSFRVHVQGRVPGLQSSLPGG